LLISKSQRFRLKISLAIFMAGLIVSLRAMLYHDIGATLAVAALIMMLAALAVTVFMLTRPQSAAGTEPEETLTNSIASGNNPTAIFPAAPAAGSLSAAWLQHFLHLLNPEKSLPDKVGLALQQLAEIVSEGTHLYFTIDDGNLHYVNGSRRDAQGKCVLIPSGDTLVEETDEKIRSCIDLRTVRRSESFYNHLPFATGNRNDGGMLLPVVFFNSLHGVLATLTTAPAFFTKERVDLLGSFCSGMALMLENHDLFHATAAARQNEAERLLAKSLLAEILPRSAAALRGWEIAQVVDYAPEHSGDFHAWINLPGEKLMIVIGKCSGQGLNTALFLTRFKTMVSCLIERCPSPADLLNQLSAFMNSENMHDLFATVAALVIKAAERTATLSLAGHPAPLINRTRSGYVEIPQVESGVPLGLFNKGVEPYKNQTIQLLPGDGILLYTEGVTEFPSGGRERFSLEDLRLMLDKLPEESANLMLANLSGQLQIVNSGRETAEDHTLIYAKSE